MSASRANRRTRASAPVEEQSRESSRFSRPVSHSSLAQRVETGAPLRHSIFEMKLDTDGMVALPPANDTQALFDLATSAEPGPLPYQAEFEAQFGQPLGDVQVYNGPLVDRVLHKLGARAAARGRQILVSESCPGRDVLAHELVHVLQSRQDGGGPGVNLLRQDTPHEQEAQAAARQFQLRDGEPAENSSRNPEALPVHQSLRPSTIALQRQAQADTYPALRQPWVVVPEQAFETTQEEQPTERAPEVTEEPAAAEPPEPTPEIETAPAAPVAEAPQPAAAVPGPETGPQPVDLAARDSEVEAPAGEIAAPVEGAAVPTAAGAAEAAAAAQQAAANLDGAGDVNSLVSSFAEAPPSVKAQYAARLGEKTNQLAGQEAAATQNETPEVHAEMAGESDRPPALRVAAPEASAAPLEAMAPAPAPAPQIATTPAPGHYVANDAAPRQLAERLSSAGEGQSTERAAEVGQALNDVRTSDPSIVKSPGPVPDVPLQGDTDPARVANQANAGVDQAHQARDEAREAVVRGPGPEQVQPRPAEETRRVEGLNQPSIQGTTAPQGAQEFQALNLPADVQASFDEANGPQMQASVQGAQEQVQQAAQQRQLDRDREVQQAQDQAAEIEQQANDDQREEVNRARRNIQTERQNSLDQQNQAVTRVEGDVQNRRDRDREEIDNRVRSDQEQIQGEYNRAETNANQEVRRGEERAAAEKERKQRQAREQSWWERAVSFVREAFEALVSAINAIFDGVRRLINGILDAAKAFANRLITAAAGFIRNAIAAFGDFLKNAVNALLADVFPELAAALNRFIDNAVAVAQRAVDVVAETLRNGINSLVEGLRAGLNAILDVYQAAVQGALSLIQAALTGDWSALLRRVIEAALRLLGIDPAQFFAFIGQAEDTFRTILNDPGAFVGHLIDAFLGGVRRFADNFLTHLQAGIISWLTGALGGAGITLPERFDLMGVLSLVQQILGLTWANLRQRAVRLIGERAVQILEFVASYIETLIQGGWPALFERIQQDLSNLKDMVLDQIKNFLLQRIVVAAITRLVLLFNPIGALVQLLMAAWNIFTFIRDRLQQIFALAQTIVQALAAIASGVIEPAVLRVEQTLAGLLPLAIDLLARFLGLGGIGERVRQIIETVRERIGQAIDRLIDRVKAMFRGGQAAAGPAGAGAAAGLIGERITIPVEGGESHTLYVRAEAQGASVIVESEPRLLGTLLSSWRQRLNTLEQARAQEAQTLLTQAEGLLTATDRDADIYATARGRQPRSGGTTAPGTAGAATAPPPPALTQEEQRLAGLLRQLYPMFEENTRATADRFEQANGQDQFHQPFTRQAWQSFTWQNGGQVSESTAQRDLAWGRDNNRIQVVQGGNYQYVLRLSDDELVPLAARLITATGRTSAELHVTKPYFTNADIRAFCISNNRLPNDAARYPDAILNRIGELLLRQADVEQEKDINKYIFAAIPALRYLPDDFDVREKYYIEGSQYRNNREPVFRRDWPKITTAIAGLVAGTVVGQSDWNDLVTKGAVPSRNPAQLSPAELVAFRQRENYDIDHNPALAVHWTEMNGFNDSQVTRKDIAENETHLSVVWNSLNRSKGSGGVQYRDTVGPQFTSQFTQQKGIQWADLTRRFKNYEEA